VLRESAVMFRNTENVDWRTFGGVAYYISDEGIINSTYTAQYSLAYIDNELSIVYSLRPAVAATYESIYNLAATVNGLYESLYNLLSVNNIDAEYYTIYSLLDTTTVNYEHTVTATVGGVSIDVGEITISCDENSYCYSVSATLIDQDNWALCTAGSAMVVTVNGTSYGCIIDTRGRQRSFGETVYTVYGRSATKQLDFPYADPVTQEYSSANAYAIANALCTASGITLQWDVINWTIPDNTLVASAQSPLEIIKQLAEACGGVLQSNAAGTTLIVRYAYPVSPTCFNDQAADETLTDTTHIISVNEQFEKRAGHNKVRVSNKSIADADENYIYIELDEVRNKGETTFQTVDDVYLRIYSNADYDVAVTAGSVEKIASNETRTMPTETVNFVHDEDGTVSRPINAISSITWMGNSLGSLSVVGTTAIRASLASATSLGIGKVAYSAVYDVWRLRPPSTITDDYTIYILAAQD